MLGHKAKRTLLKVRMVKAMKRGVVFTAKKLAEELGEETNAVSGILVELRNLHSVRRVRRYKRTNDWTFLRLPSQWNTIKGADV